MGVQNPNGKHPQSIDPSATSEVSGLGIETKEIIRVSGDMVRAILTTPKVKNAERPINVVLEPVRIDSPIPFNRTLFLNRMRAELIKLQPPGKLNFLDRDMLKKLEEERKSKQEGEFTASSDPNVQEFKGADFFLTGTFSGLITKTPKGEKQYHLLTFRLTDARTTDVIWEGSAEFVKEGQNDASYR
jgi:hypothetical protein